MSERILILAPRGRDGPVIEQALRRAHIASLICDDAAAMHAALADDAGALVMTEEALGGGRADAIIAWCATQPAWSDIPVIVLASKQTGHRSVTAADLLDRLGNVVLLERPINVETLVSAARSALRVRRRQYQAREMLVEREASTQRLRDLADTLEQRVEDRARDLERTRETLAFALDAAGMGSWDTDLTTGQVRRSAEHDRIFGYATPLPEWSNRQMLAHVVEEDRKLVKQAMARAKVTGSLDLQCRIRRPDGALRWITAQGRVDYDASGKPLRVAGVIADETERRATEDALHQAQKMEAIGQLTGGVAHDFNNLLTVIVGGLDMMIRRPDQPARVLRLAEAAMTAARRGEQLTQHLLAFSRRQMLRPETVNPNRLLLDFEPLARRAAGAALRLEFDLDPAVDPIRVDAAQFESAVLNLVVNARDAMQQSEAAGGGITVRSRNVHRATEATELGIGSGASLPGACVLISVTDTGSGFDPATLARAFEPFFTTKEVGKGSGLGLSQVYGFIRSAGGNVKIDSEVGRGTEVRLYFPRSDDRAAEDRPVATAKMPLRRAASGETVLLVEDDEQVLGMAVESLEELSYNVMVAHDAREALDHLRGAARIDIMFSDVVMPGGMNGAQLAAAARALRPELKVLLTSGYIGDLPSQQAIGTDETVLSKPYRRDELAQKLRLVLGGS